MTKFSNLFKSLTWDRFRVANQVFGIYLIITFGNCLYNTVLHGLRLEYWAGYGWGFAAVGLIAMPVILLVGIIKVWFSSTYRLIPIGNVKLYLANLLSGLVSYIYYFAITSLFCFILNPKWSIKLGAEALSDNGPQLVVFSTLLIIGLFLYGIVFISMLNLLLTGISNYVPRQLQTWVRVGGVFVLLYLFGEITGLVGETFTNLVSSTTVENLDSANAGAFLGIIFIYLGVLVMSAINIYLLTDWTDTNTRFK